MSLNPFSRRVPTPTARIGGQEQRLLLGWNGGTPPGSVGFTPGSLASDGDQAVTYDGDAPLLTCASTGSGKGRGVLIPNLLTYPGPVIVMDIKGELFQVTSRRRAKWANRLWCWTPFTL